MCPNGFYTVQKIIHSRALSTRNQAYFSIVQILDIPVNALLAGQRVYALAKSNTLHAAGVQNFLSDTIFHRQKSNAHLQQLFTYAVEQVSISIQDSFGEPTTRSNDRSRF